MRNFGYDVSVRPYVRPSVRTDSGGGGEESQGNPTGGGECPLFLAGNRAVHLGNRRFFGEKSRVHCRFCKKRLKKAKEVKKKKQKQKLSLFNKTN